MKKLLALSLISIGLPLSAALIKNETEQTFALTEIQKTGLISKKIKEISHNLSPRGEMNLPLIDGEKLIAKAGGKTYSFVLTSGENEIGSITLKENKEGELFADVSGKQGAEDYEVTPQ